MAAHSTWLLHAGSSNVTHLELWGIHPHTKGIVRLVNCCEKLKTFMVEWWDGDFLIEYSPAGSEPYLAALSTSTTLENLSLEYGSFNNSLCYQLIDSRQPVDSFFSWRSIKYLRLSASYFLEKHKNWDGFRLRHDIPYDFVYMFNSCTAHLHKILPPNIKKLSLGCNLDFNYFDPFMRCLEKFLAVVHERHPVLGVIDLEFQRRRHGSELCERRYCPFHDCEDHSTFERMQNRALQVGVILKLKLLSRDVQYLGMEKVYHPEPELSFPRSDMYDYDEFYLSEWEHSPVILSHPKCQTVAGGDRL